ncbi:hypothetical protein VFPFJ_02469 [Purpureocillium lilacinum]|uniref:Uncharacterized protein n=1 Tax=Purpureocillium lilacinum TaxID=33203 RepID=A0A179HUY3_PURLI|nr:hypothetical protein VFPFJ_02469 [Purpureocillium lilacinum]OAQ93308.1 hypothetical protein VFPFJ_02469 [Purpureocillium lilacinum]
MCIRDSPWTGASLPSMSRQMGGGGSGGGGRIDREPLARKPQAVHLSGIPAKDRAGRGPVIAAGAATPSVLTLCWSARVFDFDLM